MPISLRLPAEIEAQITGFSERQGLSKSAVIVRSIEEFLAKHAQPSSFEIYEEAMLAVAETGSKLESVEQRPHKKRVLDAIRRKHSERSKRAKLAIASRKVASKSE